MDLESFSRKQLFSLKHSTKRTNIWHGSVRSGKTFASVVRFLAFCYEAPEGPLVMVGKTGRTLKRNVLDPLKEMVGPSVCRVNSGRGEAYIFGRLVYLASANDERAQEKIRGSTFSGAYGDEVTLWPETFFAMLLSRLSVKGAKGFYTTNPDSPFHWLKKDYIDRKNDLNLAEFHFELDDNDALDPDFKEELKKEYTGLFYQRFISGLWVQAEGSVYDMFDSAVHVIPEREIPETGSFDEIFFGIDYGTSNPCVFLAIGRKGPDYYIFDEYYYDGRGEGKQKTDNQYVQDFTKKFGNIAINKRPIVCDPSATSFRMALKGDGYKTVAGNNEVLEGIRHVSSLLSQRRLYVSGKCKNTVKEFQSYVWDPKAQQRGEDKPLKENDHAMDALRYPIETLVFNKREKKTVREV